MLRRWPLAVLLLAGCATAPPANVVVFDKTGFALAYGKLYTRLDDACSGPVAARKLDAATCASLRAQGKAIEQALLAPAATAPTTIDMAQVMELLGIFAGAAK